MATTKEKAASATKAPITKAKLIAENRRARFDYFLEDNLEAGIMLLGTEIKALRMGRANIAESYAAVEGREIVLINADIPPYVQANRFNHTPLRERKLLANRKEIDEMEQASSRAGLTLVPLKAYFKGDKLKVLIGTAKGKMAHDKRADKMKQEAKVEIARALRAANR